MRSSMERKAGTPQELDALAGKRKWKNRLGMAAVSALVIALAAGSIGSYIRTRRTDLPDAPDGADFARNTNENRNVDADVVMAAGTTSVGVNAVTFAIDFLEDTSLYVEEVYLADGDSVEAGDKYIKFTQESIADARNELESAALSAQLAYRSGLIADGESRLQAQYIRDMAVLEAQFALQVYEDTIAQLDADYAQSAEAYEEAQLEYDRYLERVQNQTFYEDYEIASLKEAYEEAKELYADRKAYWEVTDDELKSSSPDSTAGMMTLSGAAGDAPAPDGEQAADEPGADRAAFAGSGGADRKEEQAARNERNWIVKTVSLLEQKATQAEEQYTSARAEYEAEIASAELTLQKLWNSLETAREDFADAEVAYQKQSLHAKTTYETAVAKGETAQAEHDTRLASLADSLERLQDAKEEADSNLALFESLVGDGYLYMEESGTVLMLMAQEGKALAGGSVIFAYSDPKQLSVSVAVSQDDIAKLCVGGTASVILSEYGSYSGVIETINPIAASDSRTSVSYTVTVNLQGDVSGLDANLTANVIFGGDISSVELPGGVPGEEGVPFNFEGTAAGGEEERHGKPTGTD